MFENQQNNSKDKNNDVNTRSIQFKNKDGFEPSTISFGYWNDFLSIRINPALPPNERSENRLYDYDKFVSTALSVEKIELLKENIKNKIIPAIENDEEFSVGVPIGGDSLIVVSTGKHKLGKIRPFIAIHKSINPDTMIPEMSIAYEFRTTKGITDYDPETGKFAESEEVHIELLLFVKILEASILALSKAFVHADRMVNKFFNNKIISNFTKIMEKLGVPTDYYKGNRGSYKQNVFYGNSNNSSMPDEPMEELDDLNDLPF